MVKKDSRIIAVHEPFQAFQPGGQFVMGGVRCDAIMITPFVGNACSRSPSTRAWARCVPPEGQFKAETISTASRGALRSMGTETKPYGLSDAARSARN